MKSKSPIQFKENGPLRTAALVDQIHCLRCWIGEHDWCRGFRPQVQLFGFPPSGMGPRCVCTSGRCRERFPL